MNTLVIDRLDITLDHLDPAAAEALRRELPAALQRRLASAGALRLDTAGDLGTLDLQQNLPRRLPPRALADAIAERLAGWLQADAAEGR